MKNLDTRVKKLESQCRQTSYQFVLVQDGETEEEARKRAGLEDWPGPLIFVTPIDAEL